MRSIGAEFDQALNAFSVIGRDFAAAVDRADGRQPTPTQVRQMEQAGSSILDVIQFQLRGVLSHGGLLKLSVEKNRLAKLLNHLPQE